jgi:hypothetical protein
LLFGRIWCSNQKSITSVFDRLVGGGWGFGNLVVLIAFYFDEGVILELHGKILLWAHTTFWVFTTPRSLADGMSRESGLDHSVLHNKHVLPHL